MIVGTLFTLFVVPAIYMVFARERGVEEPEEDEDELMGETELEPVGA